MADRGPGGCDGPRLEIVVGWEQVGSPLEYWFFRTSWSGGALLVDVILRRRDGTAELRVASSGPDGARVDRVVEPLDPGRQGPDGVAGCRLTESASAGQAGAVSWDLAFDRGDHRLTVPPEPLLSAGAMDLSLTSWPYVLSTGTVRVGGAEHVVDGRPGMACHYWGRALPPRWVWLSAVEFDRPDVAVEATILSSRLWGVRAPAPLLGYAWLRDGRDEHLVASPINGVVRRLPGGPGLELAVRSPRACWSIRARADRDTFVDLGDGVVQSLRADCRLDAPGGPAAASGTAALELRSERWALSGQHPWPYSERPIRIS